MRGLLGAAPAVAFVATLAGLPVPAPVSGAPRQVGRRPPPGLDLYHPVPPDNPPTAAKVALGRSLFFEKALSRDGTVACASCHRPDRAFADTLPGSAGVGGVRTRRNAPSILNAGYRRILFRDGRARSLEEAVLMPIRHPREMGLPLEAAVSRLRGHDGYRRRFDEVFENGVSEVALARALASYVRTLRSGDAPLDRFRAGDTTALDSLARAGLRIFQGRGNCTACHAGALLTDERFHDTGVSSGGDLGRFAVTGDDVDRGRLRTPSLRNVALTAPYMHDGSLATLEAVIDFYQRGGGDRPGIDPEMGAIHLTPDDRPALVAFLEALTGKVPSGGPPEGAPRP